MQGYHFHWLVYIQPPSAAGKAINRPTKEPDTSLYKHRQQVKFLKKVKKST